MNEQNQRRREDTRLTDIAEEDEEGEGEDGGALDGLSKS